MIRREAEVYLKKIAGYYPVVTIIGPRQSGKTTLAKLVFPDANYVNLERPNDRKWANDDAEDFLKSHPAPLIIDEVQRAPELLSLIQVMVDENPRKASYILTGSHQPLLRQGISQSLAGRTGILQLLPLSISELNSAGIRLDRDEYIFKGFMPRVHNEDIEPQVLYQDYVFTYLERDVNQMLRIADLSKFDLFVRLLAGRVGQLLNLQTLAGDVGVSSQTLSSWLSVLEASHLVFRLPCHYKNFGKRLLKTAKIYFTDVGLAASLIGIRDVSQVAYNPLLGSLFENLVVVEALKYRMNRGEMRGLYYWRDQQGLEVDLLIEDGSALKPIEIKSSRTYDLSMCANLQKFAKLNEQIVSPTVIYAGEMDATIKGVHFANFANGSCF